MSIFVTETDTPRIIAKKIYDRLSVGESTTIHGWMINEVSQQLSPTGDLVLEELRYWDEVDHISDGKRKQRVYKYEPNSIGGPIAHKIFKWNKVFVDKKPRVTIWRIQ